MSAKEQLGSFWDSVTATGAGSAGMEKVKQLPWPSWLVRCSEPSISSTRRRAMERPRPVPP